MRWSSLLHSLVFSLSVYVRDSQTGNGVMKNMGRTSLVATILHVCGVLFDMDGVLIDSTCSGVCFFLRAISGSLIASFYQINWYKRSGSPGLGWHYEAGIQFVRLILAGVFDKYPDLQIILGHWGEVVLFYLERLGSLARVTHLQRPIADYFRQNLYVTPSGMWSQSYLQRTLEVVGPERILFSTDYPYQYRPGRPGRIFLQEAVLSAEQKELFAHGNWDRLTEAICRN